ncbi:CYFA0S02e07228g1_1 [Cyberlindnera fabianii]|uniref:N-alpha-acetyltransferase 40 n=1 Tax=Cyberlindnera fabianii TaxID=36022 RepID=A0A061AVV5_CYBFA|nr:Histone-specific N-acetyltransferase NAT4 [Cyberlindnera fabianii]CDR38857.1 CYFA0S02e07228g1_1 [Cyberlindnera fabianii]
MSYQNFAFNSHEGLIEQHFPKTIALSKTNSSLIASRTIITQATPESIIPSLHLLKKTIGALYTKHKGQNWLSEKIEEMLEEGLTYVTYTTTDNRLVAFESFVLTEDEGVILLYLYEVHVDPEFHGLSIGTTLIESLHGLAETIRKGEQTFDGVDVSGIMGTKLTVFSDNTRALNWYKKLGYVLSDDSPRDRQLRGKKLVKPSYYLMERPV